MIMRALRIAPPGAPRKLDTALLANSNDDDELRASTECLPGLAF